MARVYLTDGSGAWFDDKAATHFDEGTRWDGSNHISLSTGSQWDHERLYRTKSGRWVLNEWSQWQGSSETYEEISDMEAADWLLKNGYEDSQIPDDLLALVAPHFAEAEL